MSVRTRALAPAQVGSKIRSVRGRAVILDNDLAAIYGVMTAALNQAREGNRERFPEDFLIRLTAEESAALISQSVISKPGRGGRRKLPWAFTEHGAIMAASVLNSPIRNYARSATEIDGGPGSSETPGVH